MLENDALTDFFRLAGELPRETQKKLSDLVSLVSDPVHGSAWRIVAMRFARQAPCRIGELTRGDKLYINHDRRLEKLGRMARAIFSQKVTPEGKLKDLVQAGTLRMLCTIAKKLNPDNEDAAQWNEEFRILFEPIDYSSFIPIPQYCWDPQRKKPTPYLRPLYTLKCKEYWLVVYELARKGSLAKIIGSMRPYGDFVAISLPSRRSVTVHCNAFDGIFRSIKGNSFVFFPYVEEADTSKHFLATADYSISVVRDVTTYSLKEGGNIIFDPEGKGFYKRIFVFAHKAEPLNLRYSL